MKLIDTTMWLGAIGLGVTLISGLLLVFVYWKEGAL